ncbi:MAG: acyloxyacyl hydrolase [Cupriavidus sp.]|nr:acyloxyacyl hydrolase [Cupriavidus sp.]NUT14463.1 acyloxyacyl hydrolase [Cupriavidus sp.]
MVSTILSPREAKLPRFCRYTLPLAIATFAASGAALCHAAPAVHVGVGRDPSHNINKYEIGLLWDSGFAWGNPQGWQTRLHWEVDLARWDARAGRDVIEVGASPVFRLEKRGGTKVPFLEASVGVRLVNHVSTSPEHYYSTAFRFSETIGFGLAFGKDLDTEIGIRLQHLSNAGIKKPNPGTDFITGYVRYRF